MKKRLSHFPYHERSRPGWPPSTSLRKPLSPIQSTMKAVTYVPGTFVTLVPGPYKAQTSPPGQTIQRSESSEPSARVASLVVQYRLYEVGPSQQIQSDLGSDTGP